MLDIHSHILPGVDDGSKSMEMTAEILSRYAEEGIDRVICTPHQGRELHRPELIMQKLGETSSLASEYGITLYPGAEIYYYDGMISDLKSGRLLTLNGTRHVLVEFSTRAELEYIPDACYELSLEGYVPVVAHIERYFYLNKQAYAEIKNNGAEKMVFTLQNAKGESVLMYYDVATRQFVMDRSDSGETSFSRDFPAMTVAPAPDVNDVKLRLFVDRSSIEAFGDGGKFVMTNLVFPSEPYNSMKFESVRGSFTVKEMNVYKLK